MTAMKPIPQEWIKEYVDSLLQAAAKFDEYSAMRAAALMRADHVMDLVKAWREHVDRE
jgi:hypothetical protein